MNSPRADWTMEQARAADEEYLKTHPEGPSQPIYQWVALAGLERMRPRIIGGDGFAMLAAIRDCANHDLVMPEWLAREFIRRYDLVRTLRAGSWDKAFGRPYKKGAHLGAMRKARETADRVYLAIEQPGLPINPKTFEDIGGQFKISGAVAQRYYYQAQRWRKKWGLLDDPFGHHSHPGKPHGPGWRR